MTFALGLLCGVIVTIALRVVMVRVLLAKLRRDVAALSRGDYRPLLSGSADLDGEHLYGSSTSTAD
jgi:hypothetical protein